MVLRDEWQETEAVVRRMRRELDELERKNIGQDFSVEELRDAITRYVRANRDYVRANRDYLDAFIREAEGRDK